MDEAHADLLPYVPRLVTTWPSDLSPPSHRSIEGTMLFADVSGFTKLSERLARQGKVGAEELVGVINATFTQLLAVAYAEDGGLLKFGGDALLLFFSGEGHQSRGARAAVRMRRTLREIGRISTARGSVTLRISMGIHSGVFDFFLIGSSHHDLVIAGPAASKTVLMEQAATAGEILISPETAACLPSSIVGIPKGPGLLLRGIPKGPGGHTSPAISPLNLDVSRFIPVSVRRHLAAGGEGAAHRQVTIMFLHFDGVDELHGRVGPDGICGVLHSLVSTAQTAADDHSVAYLDSDIDLGGGKIYMAAGAPTSEDDDEGRMLLAALAIRDSDPPLPVKIGINRGHVFTGDIGPAYRKTYTFMGDAVNLAARVMSRAEYGTVLATNEVLQSSSTAFDSLAVEPFTVKGKSTPVNASVVVAPAGRRQGRRPGTSLVGREQEISSLVASWDEAVRGLGGTTQIIGVAGIGKTRLLEELIQLANPKATLRVAGVPFSSSTPFGVLIQPLREALGLADVIDDQQALALLRSSVEDLRPDLLPWLPFLATPVGLQAEHTPETAAVADEFVRPKMAWAVIEMLKAIWHGPAMIVLDDAQWADHATFDLLAEIGRTPGERFWMVVISGRQVSDMKGSTEMNVGPLDPAATRHLIEQMTEDDPLLPHITETVVERSQGNPLFLGELVDSAASDQGIPDSLEKAITVRIDRLSPRDRQALRQLAVLGPSFNHLAAEAVLSPGHPPVSKTLGDFLAEDERGLRFRESLVREAAYAALPFSQKRKLHLRVGEFLESSGDGIDQDAAVLSFHFYEGKDHEKAWKYAVTAGDQARKIHAMLDAVKLYERALDAVRSLPEVPASARIRVAVEMTASLFAVGEFSKAAEVISSARRIARGDPVAEATLISKQVQIPWRTGRLADAIRWLGKGLKALEGVDGPEAAETRAKLWAWMASIRHEQGRQRDAITLSERAIRMAREAGAKEPLAQASSVLDVAKVAAGVSTDFSSSHEALAIYEELNELPGRANVLINLGGYAYLAGKWDEAIRYYEEARRECRRMGNSAKEATTSYNIAEILTEQGRLEEAEEMAMAAGRVWKAAGDTARLGFSQSLLGKIAFLRGRHDEAQSLLAEARAAFEFAGAASRVVFVDAISAEAAIARGDHIEALALVERGLSRSTPFDAMLLRIKGLALVATDPDQARSALDAALRTAEERGQSYEVTLIKKAIAQLLTIRDTEWIPQDSRR